MAGQRVQKNSREKERFSEIEIEKRETIDTDFL